MSFKDLETSNGKENEVNDLETSDNVPQAPRNGGKHLAYYEQGWRNIPSFLLETGYQDVSFLDLADNLLHELPSELMTSMPCVEELNVARNRLLSFPVDIGNWRMIRIIHAQCNLITHIVPSMSAFLQLEYMNLEQNPLNPVLNLLFPIVVWDVNACHKFAVELCFFTEQLKFADEQSFITMAYFDRYGEPPPLIPKHRKLTNIASVYKTPVTSVVEEPSARRLMSSNTEAPINAVIPISDPVIVEPKGKNSIQIPEPQNEIETDCQQENPVDGHRLSENTVETHQEETAVDLQLQQKKLVKVHHEPEDEPSTTRAEPISNVIWELLCRDLRSPNNGRDRRRRQIESEDDDIILPTHRFPPVTQIDDSGPRILIPLKIGKLETRYSVSKSTATLPEALNPEIKAQTKTSRVITMIADILKYVSYFICINCALVGLFGLLFDRGILEEFLARPIMTTILPAWVQQLFIFNRTFVLAQLSSICVYVPIYRRLPSGFWLLFLLTCTLMWNNSDVLWEALFL